MQKQEGMILENMKLPHYIANKYRNNSVGIPYDDLYSLGLLGLVKASKIFDENKGYKFNTLANKCIHSEILMEIRKRNRKIDRATTLNNLITNNEGDEEFIHNFIIDENSYSDVNLLKNTDVSLLRLAMNILTEREVEILNLVYFKGLNQYITADIIGISQSYVCKIENRALKKLRVEIERLSDL